MPHTLNLQESNFDVCSMWFLKGPQQDQAPFVSQWKTTQWHLICWLLFLLHFILSTPSLPNSGITFQTYYLHPSPCLRLCLWEKPKLRYFLNYISNESRFAIENFIKLFRWLSHCSDNHYVTGEPVKTRVMVHAAALISAQLGSLLSGLCTSLASLPHPTRSWQAKKEVDRRERERGSDRDKENNSKMEHTERRTKRGKRKENTNGSFWQLGKCLATHAAQKQVRFVPGLTL